MDIIQYKANVNQDTKQMMIQIQDTDNPDVRQMAV